MEQKDIKEQFKMFMQYSKERQDRDAFVHEHGFALYSVAGEELFVAELFVIPGKRHLGVGTEIMNSLSDVGKQNGCKYLSGQVNLKVHGKEQAVAAALAYGMKLFSANDDMITFFTEI